MKKTIILGLLAMLSACGNLSNPVLVQPGTEVGEIIIVNATDRPIIDLRIGICGETLGFGPDYGFDRLEGNNIAVGASRSFQASSGCYNISAVSGSGGFFGSSSEHYTTLTLNVQQSSSTTWTVQ